MLLIEDDVDLCALMTEFFSQHNFASKRLTMVPPDWRGRSPAALTLFCWT